MKFIGGIFLYNLQEVTMKNIENYIENKFGISYQEYEQLDFAEQQKLIKKNQRKNKSNKVIVMSDNGDNTLFYRVKKGQKVLVGTDEHGTFIEAGITPQESLNEVNQALDEIAYGKILSRVKRIINR